MQIASVLLAGSINWRIDDATPATLAIGFGWEVVNPLIPIGMDPEPLQLLPMDDGALFVTCGTLNLIVPSGTGTDEVMSRVEVALHFLRVATRNPQSPYEVAGIGTLILDVLPAIENPEIPPILRHGRVEFLRNRDRTTATLAQVVDAFREPGREPPVFATLALDAIAVRSHDYKKSILFAAFAIETLAATLLDDEYERVKAESAPAPTWHFITRSVAGGGVVRKDPIFEALRTQAGNNAKMLLHELPLYVFGRSLLQDNEGLYMRAEELRKARNSVAHGARGKSQPSITLDREGATEAIKTAQDVFRWFGAPDYFLEVAVL